MWGKLGVSYSYFLIFGILWETRASCGLRTLRETDIEMLSQLGHEGKASMTTTHRRVHIRQLPPFYMFICLAKRSWQGREVFWMAS